MDPRKHNKVDEKRPNMRQKQVNKATGNQQDNKDFE